MTLAVVAVIIGAADAVQSGLLLVDFVASGDFGECSCCGLMNITKQMFIYLFGLIFCQVLGFEFILDRAGEKKVDSKLSKGYKGTSV